MTRSSAILDIRNVSKTYETNTGFVKAVEDISFQIDAGEFVAIVGPSGAGKSTLLRIISGLSAATSGGVFFRGVAVQHPPAEFAPVFQDYARSLFPWFNVQKNITLPLVNKVASSQQRREIADLALARVGLTGFGNKRPSQLSGGQQQRVAIARAVAYAPSVLIMDEPFASVDAQTRADLEDLILRLRSESAVTVLFVTHDVDEAVYLSDRILVLSRAPSTLLETIPIELPSVRTQIETKALPAFSSARARVLNLIRHGSLQPSVSSNGYP